MLCCYFCVLNEFLAFPYADCRTRSELISNILRITATESPAETQRSDFSGERANSGMSKALPEGSAAGYGACEDDAEPYQSSLIQVRSAHG